MSALVFTIIGWSALLVTGLWLTAAALFAIRLSLGFTGRCSATEVGLLVVGCCVVALAAHTAPFAIVWQVAK